MNLDGSNVTQIDNSFITMSIGAITTDHRTQTLYVGDFGANQSIKTMDYSGGSQTTLVSGLSGNLHQMEVNQEIDKLFTVSNGSGPIYKSNLDGSNLEIIANTFSNPLGVAVDTENGYLFVQEANGGLERMDFDGANRVQLNNVRGFGLAARTTQVPEPSTIAIIAFGLLLIVRLRFKN
ncbi:PEP-CTERM sorting domain-containing protein [Glaciecola sp. MF2-115]|uniref:PEP-CTERM sorting domain-containing protein n=1 Tax=Glaciecola sp. MF2-115 TaxID=3384827 RepID=UPI0039A1E56C